MVGTSPLLGDWIHVKDGVEWVRSHLSVGAAVVGLTNCV